MIVALDSTPLVAPIGGIRRYVAELHRALADEYPEDRFLLLSDQDRPLQGLARRWWLHGLPAALKHAQADLFHGTDFAVPYRRVVPAVMTIHDLSPWRFPGETSARVRRRTPWLLRLGLASRVITPSEAIRREVISRFGWAAERVRAVPLGVGAEFAPPGAEAPGSREQPYFLAVGMGAGRKNLAVLQAAHQALGGGAELVITGVGGVDGAGVRYVTPPDGGQPDLPPLPKPDEEAEGSVPGFDKRPGINKMEDGENEDGKRGRVRLSRFYGGAVALLYPSRYEGFGLPVLEAMACGTPVIASTDPALQETAGGAALHLDPHDVRAWTEAMRMLLENPERRQQLRQAGLRRAAQFTWRRTAQLTREVYADALGRSR